MVASYLNRIEIQLLGDSVQVNLQGITRLWRSMPALWPARRFVREDPHPIEFVTRHFIGDSLQRPRVEGARHSVTSISSAVEKRFEVHGGNSAILFHSGLNAHQDRMTAAMTVKHFFAR